MSVDLVKYTLAGGEISQSMIGRSDIEPYDMSVAEAQNFFVDYRGGLSNRSGTRMCDWLQRDNGNALFMPFTFGVGTGGNYLIVFGMNYTGGSETIRFMQNGSFVLEADVDIASIVATDVSIVVTTTGVHGYSTGDQVKLSGIVGMVNLNDQSFDILVTSTTTFTLRLGNTTITNAGALPAYVSDGVVNRVYTIACPFDKDDFSTLKYYQSRNVIYITHPDYPPYKLTRSSHASWAIAAVSIGPALAAPTGVTLTPSGAATAGVAFVVTAVDKYGNESLPSNYAYNVLSVNYTLVAGSMKVTWTKVSGAVYYKVYRTRVLPIGADLTRAQELGFVGIAYGPDFTDNNIIPDYTKTPPNYFNPFANGAIEYIEVTAGGAGYTRASVVSATVGTGLVAYPIVSAAGVLLAIAIINGGSGYDGTTVISVSVGAAATFSTTLTPASGNYPWSNAVFQQRKVYAGSDNEPLTVNGSQVKLFENFDASRLVVDSDAYGFELDTKEVASISDMTPTRSGLLLWTQNGLWQLSADGGAVTPTNALAEPQSYSGVQTDLPPLGINADLLYIEAKGNAVKLLTYNDWSKVFEGQDILALASHLITPEKKIVSWAYASDPFKIVYAVREDGVMLMLSLVKEQSIAGWTRFVTRGKVLQVCVLNEDGVDNVYILVKRDTAFGDMQIIEKVQPRTWRFTAEAWFLDCALQNPLESPGNGSVVIDAVPEIGGTCEFRGASLSLVGILPPLSLFYFGGGKFVITGVTGFGAARSATCLQAITAFTPQNVMDEGYTYTDDNSVYAEPVTSVSGLLLFRGTTVNVLADGNVLEDLTIDNIGAIDLTNSYGVVTAGFSIDAHVKTLPPAALNTPIEGRIKRPTGVHVRLHETRGLKAGKDLDSLYEMKERTTAPMGEPQLLQTGVKPLFLNSGFTYDGTFYFAQTYPLPSTILSFVTSMEIADAESD